MLFLPKFNNTINTPTLLLPPPPSIAILAPTLLCGSVSFQWNTDQAKPKGRTRRMLLLQVGYTVTFAKSGFFNLLSKNQGEIISVSTCKHGEMDKKKSKGKRNKVNLCNVFLCVTEPHFISTTPQCYKDYKWLRHSVHLASAI